jgi:glycosyltransferase involved in cell wall biosynthesis
MVSITMASITALLHTHNDALRLGRALETLYACDEILLVDHGSRDDTVRIARQYGAKVVEARPGASPEDYLRTLGRGFGSLPPASSSASKGVDSVSRSARIADGEARCDAIRVEVGSASCRRVSFFCVSPRRDGRGMDETCRRANSAGSANLEPVERGASRERARGGSAGGRTVALHFPVSHFFPVTAGAGTSCAR